MSFKEPKLTGDSTSEIPDRYGNAQDKMFKVPSGAETIGTRQSSEELAQKLEQDWHALSDAERSARMAEVSRRKQEELGTKLERGTNPYNPAERTFAAPNAESIGLEPPEPGTPAFAALKGKAREDAFHYHEEKAVKLAQRGGPVRNPNAADHSRIDALYEQENKP